MSDDEPLARPFLVDPTASVLPEPVAGETEIRPYVLTGGRTTVDNADIAMETIVVAARPSSWPRPCRSADQVEKEAILALCAEPLSVAEVAAHRRLPLGVARVLVADLVGDGLLVTSAPTVAQAYDVAFIEGLIAGVTAL